MNRASVAGLVTQAVSLLIAEQPELLALDVSERALSHHIAVYLSKSIPDEFQVDVEYNRHFGDPKRLELPWRKARDRELRATTVFPDVIVHRRGSDEANLLVLEVKKPGEPLEYDCLKLRAFLRELRYQHAAHLILGQDRNGRLVNRLEWVDG